MTTEDNKRNLQLKKKICDDEKRTKFKNMLSYWQIENIFEPETEEEINQIKKSIIVTNAIKYMIEIDYPFNEPMKKMLGKISHLKILKQQ